MSADPALLLHLEGVERQRGRGENAFSLVVDGFSLRPSESLAITGPSGAGKSTVLDLLGLVLRPDRADRFVFRGRDGTSSDVAALWRDHRDDRLAGLRALDVGYVLQTGGLLPFLSVRQNVNLSRRLLALPDDAFIDDLLVRLDILHLSEKMPHALSIGERQRVAIARAFAHRPSLVLADEPTAALDPHQGLRVCELMLNLGRSFGIAIVIVTHDWGLVRTLGLPEAVVSPERGANRSRSRLDYFSAPHVAAAAPARGQAFEPIAESTACAEQGSRNA